MNNIFMHGFLVILHRWQRTKTIAELSALPDHLLADIGIERGQITSVVDGIMEKREAERRVVLPAAGRRAMASAHGTVVKV